MSLTAYLPELAMLAAGVVLVAFIWWRVARAERRSAARMRTADAATMQRQVRQLHRARPTLTCQTNRCRSGRDACPTPSVCARKPDWIRLAVLDAPPARRAQQAVAGGVVVHATFGKQAAELASDDAPTEAPAHWRERIAVLARETASLRAINGRAGAQE